MSSPQVLPMERELTRHANRTVTNVHPSLALPIGAVIAAAGVLWFREDDSWGRTCATFCVTLGAWAAAEGALGLLQRLRVAIAQSRHPHEPWRWDYPWRQDGMVRTETEQAPRKAARLVIALLALLPLARSPWAWPCVAGVIVALVPNVLRLARQNPLVRFARFPFFLGGKLQVELDITVTAPTMVTLRCVQERVVTDEMDDRDPVIICVELYRDERSLQPGRQPRLELELPADAAPTELSSQPPVYWELEVRSFSVSSSEEASALVPVYSP